MDNKDDYIFDPGYGVENINIELTNGLETFTATTDFQGNYSIYNVASGSYMVTAIGPYDLTPTTPTTMTVELRPNQLTEMNFGFIRLDYGSLVELSGEEFNAVPNAGSVIDQFYQIYLGGRVDGDTTMQGGIDSAEENDDNGVTLPKIVAGQPLTIEITAVNYTSEIATLVGFIDFNGDLLFTGRGERVSMQLSPSPSPQTVLMIFNVPDVLTNSAIYARFRISTDGVAALSPYGLTPNGEVEDYLIARMTSVELKGIESHRFGRIPVTAIGLLTFTTLLYVAYQRRKA